MIPESLDRIQAGRSLLWDSIVPVYASRTWGFDCPASPDRRLFQTTGGRSHPCLPLRIDNQL